MSDQKRQRAARSGEAACSVCGEVSWELQSVKMSSPNPDGTTDEWTARICPDCMEGVTDELPGW